MRNGHEPRFDVGVSFEGPFTVDGTVNLDVSDTGAGILESASGEYGIDYPGALRFGFAYKPRNELETTFTVESVRRFWEGLSDQFVSDLLPFVGGVETLSYMSAIDLRLKYKKTWRLPVKYSRHCYLSPWVMMLPYVRLTSPPRRSPGIFLITSRLQMAAYFLIWPMSPARA